MQTKLVGISTLTYLAKSPVWHQEETRHKQQDRNNNPYNNSPSAKRPSPYPRPGQGERKTIRTVNNTNPDHTSKLQPEEKYSYLVNCQNLWKCKHTEVTEKGTQVCNNWHIRGWCTDGCRRYSTHKPMTGQMLSDYRTYVQTLRTEMKNSNPRSITIETKGDTTITIIITKINKSLLDLENKNPPKQVRTKTKTGRGNLSPTLRKRGKVHTHKHTQKFKITQKMLIKY